MVGTVIHAQEGASKLHTNLHVHTKKIALRIEMRHSSGNMARVAKKSEIQQKSTIFRDLRG